MQRGTQTQVLPKQGAQAIGVSHVFNGAIPSASASSAPAATATATTGDGDGGHHSVLLAGRRHGRMNRSAAYLMADGDARRRCVCSVLIEGWWPALDSSVS
ncbi:uncharacterized protein LOC100276320 [Zea mays]|uniref:Uncharacterized protein n=1 Tax=Zea mays TaxID=4577 RepID=B6T8N1_MAIZE|nr:uncharacterized protein LOC100276320 [Zea mays]ACG33464.1 hypothetical protein [Zea mays]|eukprot:NP_001143607.1 uncharacterized protein LOC100276320 [Zea mays]